MNVHWTIQDLKEKFSRDLPQITIAAKEAESSIVFKKKVIELYPNDTIKRLCDYDGKYICDFSTEKEVSINTFSLLYSFLRDQSDINTDQVSVDFLTDLYFLFLRDGKSNRPVSKSDLEKWVSGLEPSILQAREDNKQRIIRKLIPSIESRHNPHPIYYFSNSLTIKEKVSLIEEWWQNYRFHLRMAIKSPEELNYFLDNTLSETTMHILLEAKKKGIPFFITPYFLSLLDITGSTFDDATLRNYLIYTKELVEAFGNIKAWEREDKIEPGKANAAGWLTPEGKNIHRRYPDVAILIPDSGGRACGGLCASCQRMYDFQSERLNFNMKDLKPKESWPLKLKKLMSYFEEDTQIRDILITGGDALMSRNTTLSVIFDAIYKMALQKKRDNENRPDGEKLAEIQRIRLGTRLLAYLPMRIDDELISILKEFRENALQIGIQQFVIQTHFQSPLEMTKETQEAVQRILSTGWIVTNQLVFNIAASRRGHTTSLRKTLVNNGVIPYYTFIVKGFQENYAVYAPIARLMQEKHEEKIFGALDADQQASFIELVNNNIPFVSEINRFLQDMNHSFAATDRSVLNLPGIGKSMTFQLVGITPFGKRILRFYHDTTRKHSPVIEKTDAIYITENKSILAYLKQLEQLGEDVKAYHSIWGYTEDVIEPKFKLYEYPDFPFTLTNQINHFDSD